MVDTNLLLPEKPRALKRAEYDRMVAMGLFEGERVELIDGTIIAMSPNDPPHASPIQELSALLILALHGRAIVRVRLPLVAADESEPEPDLAVVPIGDYRHAHPAQAHLAIEVAVSSVVKDRKVKAPLYAISGFREYWLVNVPERLVEIYRAPVGGEYTVVTRHATGAVISIEAFPDVEIRVADFLP